MGEASELRKRINDTQLRRSDLLHQLMSSGPFIAAQVYERFKTCGNKTCKCERGELHGPFLWIYQKKKGQPVLSTTVDAGKRMAAKALAERYQGWLRARQQLRELDQAIQDYLNEMERILEKEAASYATKRNPGRPKKD